MVLREGRAHGRSVSGNSVQQQRGLRQFFPGTARGKTWYP